VAGSLVASQVWAAPGSFTSTPVSTGLELTAGVMNSNSNSGTFVADLLKVQSLQGPWQYWPTATSQTDNGCNVYSPPNCLNGLMTIFYSQWQDNKPQ
jgi:hypothetical protein